MSRYLFKRSAPAKTSVTAARWALRSGEPLSTSDERYFVQWLEQDPENAAEYIDAVDTLKAVELLAGETELLAFREDALTVEYDWRQHWTKLGSLAMAATALIGLLAWTFQIQAPSLTGNDGDRIVQHYESKAGEMRTTIGEKAVIDLPDGSTVTLDTDSEIKIAYSQNVRAVYVLSGQALFDVAHGNPLPFRVFAKGQQITAVGTMFNVRIENQAVRVSMIEGVVRTQPALGPQVTGTPPPHELTLAAGEAALIQSGKRPELEHNADTQNTISWKRGVLIFNDTALIDAVAEINRYTESPIAIADPSIGTYRINGVYKTNNPESFARAMTQILPIKITRVPGAPLTLRAGQN